MQSSLVSLAGSQLAVVLQDSLHVKVVPGNGRSLLRFLPLVHHHPRPALVPHTGDALLGEVLLDLVLVHAVHRDAPPLLDELLVDLDVCGVIVVVENLLLITGTRDLNDLLNLGFR